MFKARLMRFSDEEPGVRPDIKPEAKFDRKADAKSVVI